MNEKLLARFREAYKDCGLGDDFLREYIDALIGDSLVPDENIDMVVESQRDILRLFQRHIEKRVQQVMSTSKRKALTEIEIKAQLTASIFETYAAACGVSNADSFIEDVIKTANTLYDGISES